MIVVADTNIIIRAVFTEDTPQQSEAVAEILEAADAVVGEICISFVGV